MTSIEREEKEKVKKREKKLEDEEIMQQATWVKYTIPIKHQVDANYNNTQVATKDYMSKETFSVYFFVHLC